MGTVERSGPVPLLLLELAAEDAARRSVNEMLYRRSARYRGALDAALFGSGQCVAQARRGLVVMCAHCPFCPHGQRSDARERATAGSGPCSRELERLAA